MNDPTPEEISEIRLKVVEVEFRAKSDESYLQRLRDDPLGVLKDAGFEDPTAEQLAAELSGDYGAVEQADRGCSKCDPFTCIVTGCCFFTLIDPTDPPRAIE